LFGFLIVEQHLSPRKKPPPSPPQDLLGPAEVEALGARTDMVARGETGSPSEVIQIEPGVEAEAKGALTPEEQVYAVRALLTTPASAPQRLVTRVGAWALLTSLCDTRWSHLTRPLAGDCPAGPICVYDTHPLLGAAPQVRKLFNLCDTDDEMFAHAANPKVRAIPRTPHSDAQ
jgi:hypothetical protein